MLTPANRRKRASPDECRHSVRISRGEAGNAGYGPIGLIIPVGLLYLRAPRTSRLMVLRRRSRRFR
jgi:hypothetical protein